MPLPRLQKYLADAGIASRRRAESLIVAGRVSVDGEVVRELGTRIDPERQKVEVDGGPVRAERKVYFAVNKPRGYVSTLRDPAGRPRVVDLVPQIAERVYTVGRLDVSSEGLMLLTNDGALAERLAHPRYGVEKTYQVQVAGRPGREVLGKLTRGVWLAEGPVRAKHIRVRGRRGASTVLEIVLAEGRNREIRRMLARLGHKVMTLRRIAIDGVRLARLGPGKSRPLTRQELAQLRQAATRDRAPRRLAGGLARRGARPDQRPKSPRNPRTKRRP